MPTAFAVLATLILAGSSPAIAAETATAFVDVTIVGLAGHPTLSHQTVVAQGGTIRAIGAAGHTGIPRDARRIDGHGKYLIPGLVDSHVHFWGYLRTAEGNSDVEKSILNLLLAQGITTAIVMEGSPATLAIRDKVARGIARFLDRPGNTGLVNIGAPADLVLLTADPLDDVDNAFRREGVMAKGVWYSESELRGRLLAR